MDVQTTGRHGVEAMLVLSRKSGERILIGDDVAITVVRIGPSSVRIGIEAPKSMNIVREELCNFGPDSGKKTSKHEALPL
jgi:carbon storage regulator